MAIDVPALREQVRSLLAEANTTTATHYLSANMTRKVNLVAKINPELIPINGNNFPAVTCYLDNKSIELQSISINQLNGKRRAELNFIVAGLVWNPNMKDFKEDPSQRDLEYLMENVEQILRGNDTIGNSVNWQYPNQVDYHTQRLDEQTHFRVAFMDLRATILY